MRFVRLLADEGEPAPLEPGPAPAQEGKPGAMCEPGCAQRMERLGSQPRLPAWPRRRRR